MFNLLIADDEELERKAVKKIIATSFKDIFHIFEAKNGREAIEVGYSVKPDIVIADIKMPGINGLEAIKELKKSLKYTHFIILTAYDYFAYAKEAIVNEVKDYMLKPLKKDELIERVRNTLSSLEEQKKNRITEIELKEKIYALLPVLENELTYAIISNKLNSVDYKAYLEYLNLNFRKGYCMIINAENEKNHSVFSQNGKDQVKSKAKEYIEEVIKTYHNAIVSSVFTEDIIIFIENDNDSDNYSTRLNSISLGRKIAEEMKEKLGLSITVGIGKAYSGIENLWTSYNEAVKASQYNGIAMKVKHYEDISTSLEVIEKSEVKNYDIIAEYDHKAADKRSNNSHSELMLNSRSFIEKNYNTEITLEEVAHHIGVSPYYFSKIFKAYFGKNYMDYLTDLRIEKAKDMMRNGVDSIKEICYEVGYNDPNYFSRVFKKVEGVTPSEYKNRIYN